MNKKTKFTIVLALAALTLPLSLANADVSLDWNNNTNNEVGGSPITISATPGGTITLELDLVSTSQRTDTVDYWLAALFGGNPTSAFSITQRNLSTSTYGNNPSSTDAAVAATTDMKNNTTNATGSDGVPDNQLNPRNGFDLGAGTPMAGSAGGDVGTGTFQVAIFTLSFSPTAPGGLYHIQSFDYAGRGWSDTVLGTQQVFDQPFTHQADIIINVLPDVPEPATLSLLGLGGLGALGITLLRARRRLS